MQVAEGDHEIGAAGGRDLVTIALELGDDHLAIDFGMGRELGRERGVGLASFLGRALASGGVVGALVVKIGSQNFCPESGSARPDLDDRLIFREAEEMELVVGVTEDVARLCFGTALRTRNDLLQLQLRSILGKGGLAREAGEHDERDEPAENAERKRAHGLSPLVGSWRSSSRRAVHRRLRPYHSSTKRGRRRRHNFLVIR